MKRTFDFEPIKRQLQKDLSEKRYTHTLGVTYTAAAMAMRYGSSLDQAMLAGYLHDSAKCLSTEESLLLLKEYEIKVTSYELENLQLLHAKAGAVMAQEKYNVTDEKILHAILVHTTGEPAMNLLDKIIYISDYIEPGRTDAPNLDTIRSLAFTHIDQCLLQILIDTMNYLQGTGKTIDPKTAKTYEYYNAQEVSNESN